VTKGIDPGHSIVVMDQYGSVWISMDQWAMGRVRNGLNGFVSICLIRGSQSPVHCDRRQARRATSSNRLRHEAAQVQSQYEPGLRQ
jgi:hypothetical protein